MRPARAGFVLATALFILTTCDDSPTANRKGHTEPPDTLGAERVLLEVAQPYSNHNGGGLTFDNDGYLYLGLGDGGSSGDPENNAQDPTNLLGSILRIAITEDEPYYTVPADNPFVAGIDGWRGEIYAYGLRNPWRISIDPVTNQLWAGDVGQSLWEEIDIIESGGNYGWDCREGMHDFTGAGSVDGPSPACTKATGLIEPIFEYAHADGNRSITGGYVYRGSALPGLAGRYIYGDYGTGRIWALSWDGQNATNEPVADAPFPISSFGVDAAGELYIAQWASPGKIHRLQDAGGGTYSVVEAFPALTFAYPTALGDPGDGSGRLFVLEQAGRIRAFDTADPDSVWTVEDLTGRVACCGEEGLLGLAFHPDFASNGYVYVYYTANVNSLVGRLSRIRVE
jgi:glucose/arabinose dehydrogenase